MRERRPVRVVTKMTIDDKRKGTAYYVHFYYMGKLKGSFEYIPETVGKTYGRNGYIITENVDDDLPPPFIGLYKVNSEYGFSAYVHWNYLPNTEDELRLTKEKGRELWKVLQDFGFTAEVV